jgi:hypothetical protein
MKRLWYMAIGAMLIQATAAAAPSKDKDKDKNKGHGKQQTVTTAAPADTRAAVHISFSSADVRIIREHYGTRYQNLPPGLRKKVARGGALPPGWQKKYEPFPDTVERRLGRLSAEYHRGVFDGQAVIYERRSGIIVDVAVLF